MSLRSLKVFKGLFCFFLIMEIYNVFFCGVSLGNDITMLSLYCGLVKLVSGLVWCHLKWIFWRPLFWCLYMMFFIYRKIVSFHLVKNLTIAAWIFGGFISSFYGSFWRSFYSLFTSLLYSPFLLWSERRERFLISLYPFIYGRSVGVCCRAIVIFYMLLSSVCLELSTFQGCYTFMILVSYFYFWRCFFVYRNRLQCPWIGRFRVFRKPRILHFFLFVLLCAILCSRLIYCVSWVSGVLFLSVFVLVSSFLCG